MGNLVNANMAVMPLWCWAFLIYGIFSAVYHLVNFLDRGINKKRKKRG